MTSRETARVWRFCNEEIGYRTITFDYEGIGSGQRRDYVAWLLDACAAEGVEVADLLHREAIEPAAALGQDSMPARRCSFDTATKWSIVRVP